MAKKWHRAEGERGASIVEFALISPLLFMVVFGIIDFGLVLHDDIAIQQGVREAARQATVAEFGSRESCGANLTGTGAKTTEMRRLVCLAKSRASLPDDDVRIAIRFDPSSSGLPAAAAYPAGTGSPPVGNGIIVCATSAMTSRTGFYGPAFRGKYMRSKAVMRIEKAAGTAQGQVQEHDPSGDNWAWCTP